jgi:CRISPR-associated protein (TIGR02584 family)
LHRLEAILQLAQRLGDLATHLANRRFSSSTVGLEIFDLTGRLRGAAQTQNAGKHGGYSRMKPHHYKQTLLLLCGKSPAVITETVYALNREEPSFIPDDIVVLTTSEGRSCVEKELFKTKVWDRLRKILGAPPGKLNFGLSSNSIRLLLGASVNSDASDIVTSADNDSASDFIMGTLRQFTENPDTQVFFSIAGGRKTMSAIAALAMSMLGRKQDRLCHVLVNSPFDNPGLSPKFYYPDPKVKKYKTPNGKAILAGEAEINLCYTL